MSSETAVGRNTLRGTAPKPDLQIEITPVPPIFLVGEPTERCVLAKLLDGRDGISCAPESELLVDLVGTARRNWTDLRRYRYPEQYWFRRIAQFFDVLQSDYAAQRGLSRWAATADAGSLALVDRLFPTCQVVRVLSEGRRTRATEAAPDPGSRRLSVRYYQLPAADLWSRPDAAVTGVLAFLDPLGETPSRP